MGEIYLSWPGYSLNMEFYLNAIEIFEEKWELANTLNSMATGVIAELQQQYKSKEQQPQVRVPEQGGQIRQFWLFGPIAGMILFAIIAILVYYLLSQRVKTKARLLEQEQELEQMKSDFFLNIAHELRTPLTLIRGPLNELSTDSNLSESQRRAFDRIRKNSEKLVTMAEEILQVSKMDSSKMEVHLIAIPFKRSVKRIFSSFEIEAEMKGINYKLDQQVDPDFNFLIDKAKFEKILDVLISNALKYSREGDTVSLTCREDNGLIKFKVQDTGMGIDKKDQPHIFKRYYQSKNRKNPKMGGVGIGLSLAHEMVRVLGGDITVDSRLGDGTSFTVTLYKTITTGIPGQEKTQVKPKKQTTRQFVAVAGKPTVLVVEDQPDMAEYIAEILSKHYTV